MKAEEITPTLGSLPVLKKEIGSRKHYLDLMITQQMWLLGSSCQTISIEAAVESDKDNQWFYSEKQLGISHQDYVAFKDQKRDMNIKYVPGNTAQSFKSQSNPKWV